MSPDCTCEGQEDLTDLVGSEHINGSMPAGDDDRERARQAWYRALSDQTLRSGGVSTR